MGENSANIMRKTYEYNFDNIFSVLANKVGRLRKIVPYFCTNIGL